RKPPDRSMTNHLCEYLEASAARFPDRPAVVDADGVTLTYCDLDDRASRIAGFLAARGVRRGDRVGLVLRKNADALTAVLGVLKAGAAYVPVDWTGPADRVRTILTDCAVKAVFADASRAEVTAGIETVVFPGTESWQPVLSHEPWRIP